MGGLLVRFGGLASVMGPLLGGVLTEHVSWRWYFWIKLPTGGVAGTLLLLFLNLNPPRGRSFHDHAEEFDFVGLVTAVSGIGCLLLAFNASKTTWESAETISLVIGCILLVVATQEIFPLIAGLAIGCLYQVVSVNALVALQAAMLLKDMATTTGAFTFLRMLGGAVGITIGKSIIVSTLERRLRGVVGPTIGTSAASFNGGIRQIASIADNTLRTEVMHAYACSISTIWLVNTPLSAFGFIPVVFIRAYSLHWHRPVIREDAGKSSDPEKGEEVEKASDEVTSADA
ncbi:hypothetical protein JVU11DRAFT_803 [Chiua virens]|nr:hypothetical protein JVU11DRAFT_803 [Chiua virens]